MGSLINRGKLVHSSYINSVKYKNFVRRFDKLGPRKTESTENFNNQVSDFKNSMFPCLLSNHLAVD